MGKQGKSKTKSRAGPYKRAAAKPTVEVTYEGKPDAKNQSIAKKAKGEAATPAKSKAAKADKPAKSAEAKGKSRALPEDAEMSPVADDAPTFKIVAGSYEKILYGLEGRYAPGADKPTLTPIFIFPAHLAMIKTVAASPGGKWLATGSEDEFVKVWDLRRRKEVGRLSQHTGTITSLTFPSSSHLLTTSADSTLSLFRTSDWALLKSLKGHSGRVNNVAIHPTGRVALSVGKDCTLKMWDLMRGRGAASLPLGSEAELVKFSPLGTHFAVLFPKKIQIYSLTLKLLHTLETKSRFNTLLFADLPGKDMEVLCVGTEKDGVEVYSVEIGEDEEEDEEEKDEEDEEEEGSSQGKAELERVGTLVGHTNRVKSIDALTFPAPAGPTVLLTSVSSDGNINVHDLSLLGGDSEQISPVATYSTDGSRLICVSIADGGAPRKQKAPAAGTAPVAKTGARFADDDEEEETDEEESDEGPDMYDSANEGEEDEDEMEVEFEDEDEDEEELEEEDEEEMEED